MHTHRHLFERVCALENILTASREALKNGKRAKLPGPGARYFVEMEKHAVRLRRELLEGTYRHGGYTYFTVHEPKERQDAAAAFRDRYSPVADHPNPLRLLGGASRHRARAGADL